ncbi:MAG: hypothetical protein OXF23_05700 [Candidatus Dadabacteria bacterium]|nr:hypothetical protein [Candidatus Dadabacteria bacterium]MCY4262590.1 hypothetical protein [Candidatus Dadabacteria bacterium]
MSTPIRYISPKEIRELFNSNILPDIDQGLFIVEIQTDKHPSSNKASEPYCTRSQFVKYVDKYSLKEIAWAHRYLRPDFTIGASGKPDPKMVLLDGITYYVQS